jgi:glycogen synthase
MRTRGMKKDFSWEKSALTYAALYESALGIEGKKKK